MSVFILSLYGTSVDQTDAGQFKTLKQAERHFRKKWKWNDDLIITEYL